jgi:hypothetical protein
MAILVFLTIATGAVPGQINTRQDTSPQVWVARIYACVDNRNNHSVALGQTMRLTNVKKLKMPLGVANLINCRRRRHQA